MRSNIWRAFSGVALSFPVITFIASKVPAGNPLQGVNLTRENAWVVPLMRCPMG